MIRIANLLTVLVAVSSVGAFAPSSLSSKRLTNCPKTNLPCPPTTFVGGCNRRTELNVKFLDRFRKKEGEDGGVAVLEKEDTEASADDETYIAPEDVEEKTETQQLMEQVKEAGLAGVISYALWEMAFWAVSVPVCVFGYREVTGHWPDFNNPEDMQKLGAEAFAFVNFARFAVPLRIGLALSTTPWIDENIVRRFIMKDETTVCEPGDETNGESGE